MERAIREGCKIKFEEYGKNITDIKKSLFGDDGLGGICGCLKNKVSKKILLVIAIAMTGFIIAGLTAWGEAKDERKENKQSIAVIQKEMGHIKKTTDNIEKNQIDPEDFLRKIREIIQNKQFEIFE